MLLGVVGGLTVLLTIAPVISEQVVQITDNAPGWLDDIQRNDRMQELDDKYDVIQRPATTSRRATSAATVRRGARHRHRRPARAHQRDHRAGADDLLPGLAAAIKGAAYRLAPASRRPRVTELGDRIIGSTGSYVAGAVFVSICAGISTLICTFIVGLGKYAFALAL